MRRALGRGAVDDLDELRRMERELEQQGYLNRSADRLELTAKAVRRLGVTALRRVFSDLRRGGPAATTCATPGRPASSPAPPGRWQFGDEQPLDVVHVSNALRGGPVARDGQSPRGPAGRRGLRGRRDRAAYVRRGLPAGRPVLLDGAERDLGRGQVDRAGAGDAGRAGSRRTR